MWIGASPQAISTLGRIRKRIFAAGGRHYRAKPDRIGIGGSPRSTIRQPRLRLQDPTSSRRPSLSSAALAWDAAGKSHLHRGRTGRRRSSRRPSTITNRAGRADRIAPRFVVSTITCTGTDPHLRRTPGPGFCESRSVLLPPSRRSRHHVRDGHGLRRLGVAQLGWISPQASARARQRSNASTACPCGKYFKDHHQSAGRLFNDSMTGFSAAVDEPVA